MTLELAPRQSSIVALLAQRPSMPEESREQLLRELPSSVRTAVEILLGDQRAREARQPSHEQVLAAELWEWALGDRARERRRGEIVEKVRVRNAPPSAPRAVEVLIEPVNIKGETLFHPTVYWTRKGAAALPYVVFPTQRAAIEGSLELAKHQWEEQFKVAPDWDL